MKVRIYARQPPEGRCLILAQKLTQLTTLPPTGCVALAERLFAFAHQQDNPAVVEISEPIQTEALATAFAAFGISVEQVV